jgi:hypothetical protein
MGYRKTKVNEIFQVHRDHARPTLLEEDYRHKASIHSNQDMPDLSNHEILRDHYNSILLHHNHHRGLQHHLKNCDIHILVSGLRTLL